MAGQAQVAGQARDLSESQVAGQAWDWSEAQELSLWPWAVSLAHAMRVAPSLLAGKEGGTLARAMAKPHSLVVVAIVAQALAKACLEAVVNVAGALTKALSEAV